jgi:hypothetical protein
MRPTKSRKMESQVQIATWEEGIKSSLDVKDPLTCPICKNAMTSNVIYSFQATNKEKQLKSKYDLIQGYFYPKRTRDPPDES